MSSVQGRRVGKFAKMCSFGVIALLCMAGALRAAVTETEVRDFAISVDGRSCGNYRMTISRHDDGKVSVSGDANVLIKKVLITVYRYTYNGTEWWQEGKDSRLLRLDSTSNEDGKQLEVHAVSGPNGLRVMVNGQERTMSSDAWTTTYWRLAPSRFINKAVPLLDADTGRAFNGRLEFVGTEQLNVGGQNQACRHFRVTGGPNNVDELWYDAQDRLVRQEFTERNARTVLTLVRVSR
jgi:Family of unknown function (DUF6134)